MEKAEPDAQEATGQEVTETANPSIDQKAGKGAEKGAEMPPDLARIVDAWATLPDAIRAAIVGMVNAVKGN